jgi:GTP-binding protein HflX
MSNARHEEQVQVVESVLNEIGAGEIPTLLVPNKVDVAAALPMRQLRTEAALDVCPISALTGAGVDRLLELIGAVLDRQKEEFHACFSQAQGELIALLRERGRVVKESYDGDMVRVTAMVTPKLAGQMRKLLRTSTVHGERMS